MNIEGSSELKSVEVNVVTNFIEDKIESFSDTEVILIMMMTLKKIGSLDLGKMCVASNTLVMRCGALWDTENALEGIIFFQL